MRIHPWLAALSSVVLLVAAGETFAQAPEQSRPGMSFEEALAGRAHLASELPGSGTVTRGQSGPPGYYDGNPRGFQPAYGNKNPAAIWPPNTPPSYKPHPEISPYYHPSITRDMTYNDRGLWFRELLFRDRDYYFTLEYLSTDYASPGNRNIGARTIPVSYFNNQPWGYLIDNYGLGAPAEFGPDNFQPVGPQRVIVGPGVIPYPVFPETQDGPDIIRNNSFAFPVHRLNIIENMDADGIRARWGYNNEDGTGTMLTGWYGGLGKERFQRGTDNWRGFPITQELILANVGEFAPIFPRNGVLPLEVAEGQFFPPQNPAGVDEDFGLTGWSQKFDVLFQVDVETRTFGSTLNLYHEPIYKRKWVTVRPTYGARYIYFDDRFGFRGIDSGLFYTVDDATTTGTGAGGGGVGGGLGGGDDGGGAGGGAGGAGGGGQQGAPTFRPTGDSVFVFTDNGIPIDFFFEANLKSAVDSHLAGPEAGLRYDFGQSKNFAIWGQSTFALLANHERVKIQGENIGLPYETFLTSGVNFVDDDVDTRFRDSDTHTHASPMFEQSVFVEANVLRYIPVINKVHLLEQAQFQAGFTYTVIGQMARAGESIDWNAFPDVPYVDIDYRTWHMTNWSFGVNWNY